MHNKICIDKKKTFLLLGIIPICALFIYFTAVINQGKRITQSKAVFGGKVAKQSDWPFMVILYDRSFLKKTPTNTIFGSPKFKHNLPDVRYCGGTLIDSRWVLTAAHCLSNRIPEKDISIAIGFNKTTDLLDNENTVTRDVMKGFTGPYTSPIGSGDIALLKLDSPLPSQFKTISIGNGSPLEYREKASMGILGWGKKEEGDSVELRLAVVPLVSNERANKASWDNGMVTNMMIAGGYPTGGESFCFGDSGGPFIIWDGMRFTEPGIVVWTQKDEYPYACGQPRDPTIATRVSSYFSWIQKTISDNDGGKVLKENSGTFDGSKRLLREIDCLNTTGRCATAFEWDDKNNK